MLNSGNFVLYNEVSEIIWQTFDYPTDTIVGGQTLSTGMSLISSLLDTDRSTGRYTLTMQGDGNLVLYPLNTEATARDAYWASGFVRTDPCSLYLNSTGSLAIINNSNSYTFETLFRYSTPVFNINETLIYCATLDSDGVFKFYCHTFTGSDESPISVGWKKPTNPCEVKGLCGLNSFCTLDDDQPSCRCLPGTNLIDPNRISLGCGRNSSREGCTDCKKSCLEDCNCEAAQHVDSSCKKYSLPLKYVRRDLSSPTVLFKEGTRSIKSDTGTVPMLGPIVVKSKKAVMLILILTIGLLTSSCAALAISGLFVYKIRILRYRRLLEYGYLGLPEELTLQLFSYNELRRATNGFKEELGKGSFGSVYRGTLCKGKKIIALKRLEKVVEEGEREFNAEVRAIGRTNHRNLVQLLGYCNEDSKRLLVYEYMSNGSLADLLFKSTRRPDWKERVRIALNVARGILYLHDECEAPIIHCDIKPQNILMDDFWIAKISDFGLSKLLMPDQTRTFTGIRGTRGYLAPEWQRNTPISIKADIYSYGIVLLEIVCCRRNLEVHVSNPEELILSSWVYKCFVGRELNKLVGGEEVDKKTLENMVKVALWCIQDEPHLRPSMKSVWS
ncbi:protein kinase superfamily protein [Actinidia rufa]|uniref:non-specific serine/threonine protein kinase n=1 Tax=Actinidia rufa TaxID=165716 RepID=A0A7J0EXQ2_9ERIC|nr:protein kinase superfamily protein [Actinidia rufa]